MIGAKCMNCGHTRTSLNPPGWCIGCGESYAGPCEFMERTKHLSPRDRIIATWKEFESPEKKPFWKIW